MTCACGAPAVAKGRCLKCYNRNRYLTKVKTDPVAMANAAERKRARRLDARARTVDNACDMRAALRRFGLTLGQYAHLLATQNAACAICGRLDADKRLAVDHCHATGRVRGLLCQNCNQALGKMQDAPERLRAAASYLERPPPSLPAPEAQPTRGQREGERAAHARLSDAQVRLIKASPRGTTFTYASADIVSRIRRGLIYRWVS